MNEVIYNRFNSYRNMWVMVLFDLPTDRARDRKAAAKFRNDLIKSGFTMFQFSIYMRFCISREASDVHIKRVKRNLPAYGKVGIFRITDKQFGQMELFHGKKPVEKESGYQQLEIF